MLIQFSVKNYLSFKERQDFSMEAGIGDENIDNVICFKDIDERVLKTTALYGANASGKTNLIKAFDTAIKMIKLSNNRQPGEKLFEMEPFAFDEISKKNPCEFEFIFYINSKKYIYGFKADKDRVYEEYLYQYLSQKPTRIFERKNCIEYKFLQVDESKLNSIKTKNLDNKLFLSTATTWNYERTKDVYLFFANNIYTYLNGMDLTNFLIDEYENDEDNSLKKFTLKLLEESDIIIKDFKVEVEDNSINMLHEIIDENGKTKIYNMNLSNESSGTKILVSMAPILKQVFENKKILIVDEIERSLHPNLVEMIIKFFHNKEINKCNSQLIFNTHDTNLLSLDLFRRDQIWFSQKDINNGATEIYPLDDFSVRKTENIRKGYLNGRFGAIPFLIIGDNVWQK